VCVLRSSGSPAIRYIVEAHRVVPGETPDMVSLVKEMAADLPQALRLRESAGR
jgi:hypothetical protein